MPVLSQILHPFACPDLCSITIEVATKISIGARIVLPWTLAPNAQVQTDLQWSRLHLVSHSKLVTGNPDQRGDAAI
jgi:hypothetical protein